MGEPDSPRSEEEQTRRRVDAIARELSRRTAPAQMGERSARAASEAVHATAEVARESMAPGTPPRAAEVAREVAAEARAPAGQGAGEVSGTAHATAEVARDIAAAASRQLREEVAETVREVKHELREYARGKTIGAAGEATRKAARLLVRGGPLIGLCAASALALFGLARRARLRARALRRGRARPVFRIVLRGRSLYLVPVG